MTGQTSEQMSGQMHSSNYELLLRENFELKKLLQLKDTQIKILRYEKEIEQEWSQDLMNMLGVSVVSNIKKNIRNKKHNKENLKDTNISNSN